ncbi:LysR family transcriptional regulator, regulator of gene expression of beta-lactamase [Sphingomonas guangdongensis]|uniref:LysR family transcriptional regulator, regulator of gene expression of beta-lactamase n=1 Tax=Sphingomonas guangdongensis TaxID=1141890 RepID=A0A285QXU2_9SPHN|nr:LysR family transcriptional regulator [Sphingomonas guangdongensis]SOB86641.1 LysR family transcriptional regulator, regulator of gene expression of beta-lactamase [Sphingomonas guangdongensis]
MDRAQLPLNALRAFEASARHGSFTRAGLELCVGQAAVSHHVNRLEALLGVRLFHRLPRGLALTDEGAALLPVLGDSLDRIAGVLGRYTGARSRETLTVGVVGTFAVGWLLPRLAAFTAAQPFVDVRLRTNNNRVDLAGEGLDYAIRFGDGAWHGTEAVPLLAAPLTVVVAPTLAEQLSGPRALAMVPLLRSYRADEWPRWFAAAELACPPLTGAVFDSSVTMAAAVTGGAGAALLPPAMFAGALDSGTLLAPFTTTIDTGRYWLTRLKTRPPTEAMRVFRTWIEAELRS